MATRQEILDELNSRGVQPNNIQPTTGVTREQIQAELQSRLVPVEENTTIDNIGTGLKTGGVIISGAIAEPIAGLAGLATTFGTKAAQTFGLTDRDATAVGEDVINSVRNFISLKPDADVQEVLKSVSEAPVVKQLIAGSEKGSQASGDFFADIGESIGGQEGRALGGSFGKTLFEGGTIALGGALGKGIEKGVGSSIKTAKKFKNAKIDNDIQNAIEIGKDLRNGDILTTDVFEPKTVVGRFFQKMDEGIPIIGSGATRAKQQTARQDLLEKISENYNISNNQSDIKIIEDVLDNMTNISKRKVTEAADLKTNAIDILKEKGFVGTSNTKSIIKQILDKEIKKGASADKSVIKELNDIKNSVTNQDFQTLTDIRTTALINKVNDIGGVNQNTNLAGALKRVKMGLDKDLRGFAKSKDANSLKNWDESNKLFTEVYSDTHTGILKNLEKVKEFDPEKLLPVLRKGNPKELKRINGFLDKEGKEAIKTVILRDGLEKAGFFKESVDLNPNAFLKYLDSNTKTINEFFPQGSADRKILNGYKKYLSLTKRAQDASVLPANGIQVFQAGLIGGSFVQPSLLGIMGTVSGFNKLYNSKNFRNFMLKMNSMKVNSPKEKNLLENITDSVNKENFKDVAKYGIATNSLVGSAGKDIFEDEDGTLNIRINK